MEPRDPFAILAGQEGCLFCCLLAALSIPALAAVGILLTYVALQYSWVLGLLLVVVVLLVVVRRVLRR